MSTIISISGAPGNGKSSIFNEFKKDFNDDKRFLFIEEMNLKNMLNKKSDGVERSILKYYIEALKKAQQFKGIAILENSILDVYIYAKYKQKRNLISKEDFDLIEEAYKVYRKEYTAFFIPTHFDLKYNDEITFEQREELASLYLGEYNTSQFHWISGSMYVRIGHLYDVLKFYTKQKFQSLRTSNSYDEFYPKTNLIKK